jgi:hypothetical protein
VTPGNCAYMDDTKCESVTLHNSIIFAETTSILSCIELYYAYLTFPVKTKVTASINFFFYRESCGKGRIGNEGRWLCN